MTAKRWSIEELENFLCLGILLRDKDSYHEIIRQLLDDLKQARKEREALMKLSTVLAQQAWCYEKYEGAKEAVLFAIKRLMETGQDVDAEAKRIMEDQK